MPLTLEVADHAARVTASGTVTYQEVVYLIAQRLADPARIPGLPVLFDGRGVTGAPSAAELRLIATQMKPLIDSGLGPVAIVAGSAFTYGVVRMFAVFAQAMSANVAAYRREADAQRWLTEQRPATG